MALVQVILPDDLTNEVDRMLDSLVRDEVVNEKAWQGEALAAARRYAATGRVPKGYTLEKRGRSERLVPEGRPPLENTVTKRGVYIALVKIALRHSKEEILREVRETGIKRGRPPLRR